MCVCVFFTLNRSSTRRHPAHPVSVLILHPGKISSVVTSYDTEIMHRNAFNNAMSCPSTGYDRRTRCALLFGFKMTTNGGKDTPVPVCYRMLSYVINSWLLFLFSYASSSTGSACILRRVKTSAWTE